MLDRLVWAEINLKNYSYNFSAVTKIIGSKVKIMAIVKANAYGHGAVMIAKQAAKLGTNYLGVVCLYEAKQLRTAGIKLPILVLNYIDSGGLEAALEYNLTVNIMEESLLKTLNNLARKQNKRVKIHVKIDTGMHRLGLLPEQALKYIPKIENYKNIVLEGIFTHFATADETSLDFTVAQLDTFNHCLLKLSNWGINPPLIHAANSAATLRLPQTHFDMVRPGIILYGMPPSNDFKLPFIPKPVLSLKTKIVQIRKIGKGETVGYGRTFKATKNTIVASLPVGYADGFRRAPNNWGYVLVCGRKSPILGRISMDQTSIDITKIPYAKVGDEVVLIGCQGNVCIKANDVGKRLGTINYEVTSALAARVARVYIR